MHGRLDTVRERERERERESMVQLLYGCTKRNGEHVARSLFHAVDD
jgi:hypothetical protein